MSRKFSFTATLSGCGKCLYYGCANLSPDLLPTQLQAELVAIVVPDFEVALVRAQQRGWGSTSQELCANPKFKAAVLADMDAVGKRAKLRGFEFAKAIHLVPELFTVESGLLTPTQKIKRPEAKVSYAGARAAHTDLFAYGVL